MLANALQSAWATTPPPTGALAPGPLELAQALAGAAARQAAEPGVRVEVKVGELDPRLRLAPCERVEPFMPAGLRPWGRTRVGLRCVAGRSLWSVTLPVHVAVFRPGVVTTAALPAGTTLSEAHLVQQEVDWGVHGPATQTEAQALVGRVLSRPVVAGAALSLSDLRPRQWFGAGDRVRMVAAGPGFQIESEGVAVTAGMEGQPARIRTAAGQVLVGRPRGRGEVEMLPPTP